MGKIIPASEVDSGSDIISSTQSRIISANEVDEMMPDYASGMNPDSPVNRSPVDIADRFKLALGNAAGSKNYLKQKFDDVQEDSSGNLVVKHQGLWHRVDPTGLGDPDPWDATKSIVENITNKAMSKGKEFISDAADVTPMGASIAAGTGANIIAGVGSGGTSLPAAAAIYGGSAAVVEGLRTSLGRAVGTYEATDAEQLSDIGFEGVLNAGGVLVAPAVKVGGKFMADNIGKIGQNLGKLTPVARDAVKGLHGVLSGTGAQIDRLVERNPWVSSHLRRAVSTTKNEAEAVHKLVGEQISQIKKFASKVQPAMSAAYKRASAATINSVDNAFDGNVGAIVDDVYKLANNLGIGKFDDVSRKFILHSDDDLAKVANQMMEAGDSEKAQMIKQLFGSKEAKNILEEFFQTVSPHAKTKTFKGKLGAQSLITFRQAINGRVSEIETKAFNEGAHGARKIVGLLDDRIDAAMKFKFQPKDLKAANPYTQLQSGYRQVKGQLQPILNTQSRAIREGGEKAYEDLINNLAAKGGKQVGVKNAFHEAVEYVSKNGDSNIRSIYDSILDREASKAFIPKIRPGVMGAGAIISGSMIKGPIGAATGLAATSPRLNSWMINKEVGAKKMIDSLVQKTGDTNAGKFLKEVGFQGLDFLKQVGNKGQLQTLFKDENAVRAFSLILSNAVSDKYKLREQLLSQAAQQTEPIK